MNERFGSLSRALRVLGSCSLVVIAAFTAVSTVGGGLAIIATSGRAIPKLVEGPFGTSFWLAAVLLILVGATHAVAAALLVLRRRSALVWMAAAGFAVISWIFLETGISGGLSWVQVVSFATGMSEVILVLTLAGAVTLQPREPLRLRPRLRVG